MSGLLYPTSYVKPGTYVGELSKDIPTPITRIQFPVVIGRGSKYIESTETVVRGFVYQEAVSVSNIYPNVFKTKYPFLKDKKKITVYKDSSRISEKGWTIVDDTTIQLLEYDPSSSYFVDYQSTSKDVKDRLYLDVVKFNTVGNSSLSKNYEEFENFYLDYILTNRRRNKQPDSSVIKFNPSYSNENTYPILKSFESTFGLDVIIDDVSSNIKINGFVSVVAREYDEVATGSIIADDRKSKFYDSNVLVESDSLLGYEENGNSGLFSSQTFYDSDFNLKADDNGSDFLFGYEDVLALGKLKYIWLEFDYQEDGFESRHSSFKIENDGKYHYWKGIGFKITNDNINGKVLIKAGHFYEEYEEYDTFSLEALSPKKLIEGPERVVSAKIVHSGVMSTKGTISNVVTEFYEYSYYIDSNDTYEKDSAISLTIDDYFYRGDYTYLVFVLKDGFGNATYKEVRCDILNGKFSLVDDSIEIELNGLKVVLYKTVAASLLTEDYEEINTEDGDILLIEADTQQFKFKHTLITFDFVRSPSYDPTIVEVSNSYSKTLEKLRIDYDDYYSFNGILSRLGVVDDNDIIEFDVNGTGYICWNLTDNVEEDNPPIFTDYSGELTGEYCSKYIKLKGEYINNLEVISVEPFDYRIVEKDGQYYLIITLNGIPYEPRNSITIKYRSYTSQPELGNNYYVSALCIRPDSMYNTLIEVQSLNEGRELIGPFDTLNDLYIANEIAWREFSQPLSYGYVQIKDSDNDDVIQEEDIDAALKALITNKRGTDIVLLRNEKYLGKLIKFSNEQNSPFEQNENKIWISSQNIDDVDELSIEEYAEFKNVVANDSAKIKMSTYGVDSTLNVDGSFIAWAFACARNFIGYSESLLNTKIKSFSYIKTFNDLEEKEFGSHNIMFISGTEGNYKIAEDSSVVSIEQISNQKIISVRYIRNKMNEECGKVSESPQESLSEISTKLVVTLNELVSKGYISNYLDENGNKRPLDAKLDIFVRQLNQTQFQFGYGFYTKKGMRHLFGNYIVDSIF
jgi:hypothetical protein